MTAPVGWSAAQPLDTPNLLLEPLRVEHAKNMAGVLDDPRLHTYVGGQPATLGQLRERYRRQVVGRSGDGSQLWFNWVLRHRKTGLAVGFVQATLSTQNGESVAELAWVIASAHQGQGYARHATKAVVRWLRKLGANLIIAHVHPYHQASMAVAAGIGMSPSETNVDGEVRWVG
jgi:RimJ/RimL family protein N-acetyltransferase